MVQLRPETLPRAGQVISPLDAGAAAPWIVERILSIDQAQFCGATFAEPGPVYCLERFAVVSITELAAQ